MTKILVMQYQIVYTRNSLEHIRLVEKKYWSLIRDEIEKQLVSEPHVKAKNRKYMGYSWVFGTWVLRCRPGNRFRIFDDVDEAASVVTITAIGIKRRNRLYIGNREIVL